MRRSMSVSVETNVLSIQSSVVFGYVGNKSATFPLQILGFDVSTINSVQFSNHTVGYKVFKGQVLNSDDVSRLYDGLKENGIDLFSHVLTGYIGSKSFLEKVAEIVTDLKKCNPNILYVCDPVMGDNGKMYVPPELLPVYRDVVVPLADVVTPNQFEAEQLTGITIESKEDAIKAIEILHSRGVKIVVISSSNIGDDGKMLTLASTANNGLKECYQIQFPMLDATFVGTGDLFAACLLGWIHKSHSIKVAFERTISTVQAVIRRTLEHAQKMAGPGNKPTPAQMELRLIQSKSDIENPQNLFTAEYVPFPS